MNKSRNIISRLCEKRVWKFYGSITDHGMTLVYDPDTHDFNIYNSSGDRISVLSILPKSRFSSGMRSEEMSEYLRQLILSSETKLDMKNMLNRISHLSWEYI